MVRNMTSLLTLEEQAWLSYHMQLASLREYDIVEFSRFSLEPQPHIPANNICGCGYDEEYGGICLCEKECERDSFLYEYCEPASLEDYNEWLAGYLTSPRNKVDEESSFPKNKLFKLRNNPGFIPEWYGAESIELIVPIDCKLHISQVETTFHGNCGHNSIYFMLGYQKLAEYVYRYV